MAFRVPTGPEINPRVGKEALGLLLKPKRVMAVDEIKACLARRCRVELVGPDLQDIWILKGDQNKRPAVQNTFIGEWGTGLKGR